jgi:hypothetical protein
MKIAFYTLIAFLSHIAAYLFAYKLDLIPRDVNVSLLWSALFATFAIGLISTLKQITRDIN